MAETLQQEQQKVAFPEIRDSADMYAEAVDTSAEESASAIDVEIDNMVWEVDSEPADDAYSAEDAFGGEMYRERTQPQGRAGEIYDDAGYGSSDAEYDDAYDGGSEYSGRPDMYEEVPYARKFNKHIFTWVLSCVCGFYGVDRFARGQISLGVLKLLTFGGLGFWYLADLGIAIYKSYMDADGVEHEDLHFDSLGRYV